MAYEAAPIVEAIHFIQFADELSEADIRRIGRKMFSSRDKTEDRIDFSMRVENGRASADQKFNSLMMTSPEGDFVLLLGRNFISTSRRAPYLGWDNFEPVAWQNYLNIKKSTGPRKIEKIALRYINRIDVKGLDISWGSYVKTSISFPIDFTPKQYALTSGGEYRGLMLVLNLAATPSPLVLHSSFIVDIELTKGMGLASRDDGLRSEFLYARGVKNELFETIITDQARQLFSMPHHVQ